MVITSATRPGARLALLSLAFFGLTLAPALAAEPITWRTDYNSARKEAQEKGLPLFVEIGTEECFYCRKLENGPFRDPAVSALIDKNFVALKIDANREPALARALKVSLYPTMVLAGHDGKIHAFLEGYMESDRIKENLTRVVTTATTPDGVARDFQEATRSLAASDYPRAVSLLKGVVKEAGNKPVGAKAKEVLDGIERLAVSGLTKAKEKEQNGHSSDAMDALADLMQTYSGTQAAADAAALLAGLGNQPETRDRLRVRRARELLAMAKDEFRTQKYYDCLQHCEQLTASFADLAESKEAGSLASDVQSNPDRLATACEQMNERTAAMYLTLADSWSKKGQAKEAAACLEKVMRLSPDSRLSAEAQGKLAKLEGRPSAVPTGFRKPSP